MSSRATKHTNSEVIFFQLNGRIIKCFCTKRSITSPEPYTIIEIKARAFEQWLEENGFLETIEHSLYTPDAVNSRNKYNSIKWSYTIDEFLHSSNHPYDINSLLSQYIKENNLI